MTAKSLGTNHSEAKIFSGGSEGHRREQLTIKALHAQAQIYLILSLITEDLDCICLPVITQQRAESRTSSVKRL